MYKTLPIVALLLSTAACSIEQKPAPYVEKGDERFSKSASSVASSSTYRGASPVYDNSDYIDAPASSATIQSRSLMPESQPLAPLNRNDGVIDFSSKAQNSDYIDAEAKAVPLAPLHSSIARPTPVLDTQATNNGKGYLDLGAVNKFGSPAAGTVSEPKKTSKLLSAKPLAKPVYKEIAESAPAPVTTPEAPIAIETVAIPSAPIETAAPVPMVQKIEHTTKLSDNTSVTTTKTIERVGNATPPVAATAKTDSVSVPSLDQVKNGEAAIEKSPIVEEKKPAATASAKQFIRPVTGKIIGKFGNEPDGTFNDGIKIRAAKGADVKAADGGEVVYSGNQLQGYGNMIIIRHANGYLTSYAHLENLDIKKGAKVGQGDIIGHVGDTGNVTEPMLHFGVREGREPVDPKKFLK